MKKSLIALAVLGAVAGVAQAQTNVTIYGTLDVGFQKVTDLTTGIQRGDNNKLGFKGTEDLGGGLKATFQIEERFQPDTGTVENGTRPQWQGQTSVGLAGNFGAVRLGRALTSVQAVNTAFDPFATATVGAMAPFFMGGFNSDALSATNAQNRYSNGFFYNSPVMSGFQVNASAATKESNTPAVPATNLAEHAYSLAGTYNNGPIAAMLGYERNGVNDKYWQLAGAYNVGVANLMASYAETKFGVSPATPLATANTKNKSWMLGADVVAGPGNVKVAYGEVKPDTGTKTKKFSAGYWYNLSKRTYVYLDGANTKTVNFNSINSFDLGLHHNF